MAEEIKIPGLLDNYNFNLNQAKVSVFLPIIFSKKPKRFDFIAPVIRIIFDDQSLSLVKVVFHVRIDAEFENGNIRVFLTDEFVPYRVRLLPVAGHRDWLMRNAVSGLAA